MTIEELLKETGESDVIDDNAQTPSPEALERLANEPATMLWTLRLVQRVTSNCWVKKWVRGFRMRMAYAVGAAIAAQVLIGLGGYFVVRVALREAVRGAVIEVLREKKIIADNGDPGAPAGVSLASLAGVEP